MAGGTRNLPPIDYLRLHEEGTTEGLPRVVNMAEQQLQQFDQGHPPVPRDGEGDSTVNSRPEEMAHTDTGSLGLEGADQLLDAVGDNSPLVGDPNMNTAAEDAILGITPAGADNMQYEVNENEDPNDLGRDEVWQAHQAQVKQEADRRYRLKKRLARQIIVAEERVRAEQEKQEILKMQQQVKNLDQQRLVPPNLPVPSAQIPNQQIPTYHEALTEQVYSDARMADQITPAQKVNIWFRASPLNPPPTTMDAGAVGHNMVGMGQHNEQSDILRQADAQFAQNMHNMPLNHDDDCRQQLRDVRKQVAEDVVRQPLQTKSVQYAAPQHSQPPPPPPMHQQHSSGARPKQTHRPKVEQEMEGELCTNADNSSVRSASTVKTKDKRIKSGFLDKPRTHVLTKLKWPHMNQNPRYVTTALTFKQLNFQQFVGGECRTILKSSSEEERKGRLNILSKVAYLYDQCGSWERARAAYFAIIGSLEEGESTWDSPLGQYDMMCPPNPSQGEGEKGEKKNQKGGTQTVQKKDYFCKDYQRGECNMQSPHRLWINNKYEQVEHYCIPCFKTKMGKLQHVPNTEQCSQKK